MKNNFLKQTLVGICTIALCFILLYTPIGTTALMNKNIATPEQHTIQVPNISECAECGQPLLGGSYYVMTAFQPLPKDHPLTPIQVLDSLPVEFSWKNYNGSDWTTPAKNQGGCWSL